MVAAAVLVALSIAAAGYFSRPASAAGSPPTLAQASLMPAAPSRPEPSSDDARESEFQRLMVQGNAALARQHFKDAFKSYAQAQKLFPEDVDAAKGLSAARAALASESAPAPRVVQAKAVPESSAPSPANLPQLGIPNVPQIIVDPEIGYEQLMNQAAVAMLAGRYDEAQSYYAEALQLSPHTAPSPAADFCPPPPCNDLGRGYSRSASQVGGLPFNRRGLPAGPANSAAFNGLARAGYLKAMADGDAGMRAQKYDDAARAFEDALRARPNDRAAASALTQAEALAL
jgi:tetratricopeptide (TPR) repeat protein